MKDRAFIKGVVLLGGMVAAKQLLLPARRYSFKNRYVVITGGSRGLGFLLATEIIRLGGHPILIARTASDLEEAKHILGESVATFECDVSDRERVDQVVAEIVSRFKRIDVLINNAGIMQFGPSDAMTLDDYERAMGTHFWGPLNMMFAVVPHMKKQRRGRIVNIASIGGKVAVPHMAPYSASKFALVGLSDGLRAELAQYNIKVTTVSPWLMRTGSHLNISVKGRHREEFAWFAALAARLFSLDGERAARKIIDACALGKPSLNLGIAAKLAICADALMPSITAIAMKATNSILPQPLGDSTDYTGWESRSKWAPSRLTRPADRKVLKNNELRGHSPEELSTGAGVRGR